MDNVRRKLIQGLCLTPLLCKAGQFLSYSTLHTPPTRVQYSINAYSFNSALSAGEMTFFDMMQFAADIGLDAVDLTGYYFPSYPQRPDDQELFELKRKAFHLGLDIAWTGIRNDFVNPDEASRKSDIEMVKEWLEVTSTLGGTIMRIFAGIHDHEGFSREEVKKWMVDDFKTCARYASESGVILGLQHHYDFLFEVHEIIDILKKVDSEWFGLILDVGSLRSANPYDEIQKLAPYADYWFIKEHVYTNGVKEPIDMKKVASIIKGQGYRGYISFESLSDGDPKTIITSMFNAFRKEYDPL